MIFQGGVSGPPVPPLDPPHLPIMLARASRQYIEKVGYMLSSVIVKTLLVHALLTYFAFTLSSLQSEKNIFKSGSNSSLSN